MRQDPDIIMVGEIRDLQTAEMAMQAALTGHLVFSTLHTNDAPSAITRLMDLGVPPYLINATVIGVLAQRLVRTLCRQCRQPDEAHRARGAGRGRQALEDHGRRQPYRPVGCVDCRMTGFLGRMGLYELLTVSEALQGAGDAPACASARGAGDRRRHAALRLAGALRVAEGADHARRSAARHAAAGVSACALSPGYPQVTGYVEPTSAAAHCPRIRRFHSVQETT